LRDFDPIAVPSADSLPRELTASTAAPARARLGRYAFLDGLRGLAAIFVLTGHTYEYWHFGFFRAYLAVDIFFVLSGFVIAHAYDESLRVGTLSAPRFMIIRLIRLYPVYLLSVVLCAAILIGNTVMNRDGSAAGLVDVGCAIGMTLLFLPYYIPGIVYLFPVNQVYWSLFFELATNAMYAFARPRLTNFWLVTIVLLSGLGVVALAVIHGNLNAGHKWMLPHIGAALLRSVFGIFLGLLLYRLHADFAKFFEKVSPWWIFALAGLILASPSAGRADAVIDIICVGLLFPLCVLVGSRSSTTAFEGGLLVLGSARYPIYVLHLPAAKTLFFLWPGLEAYAPLSGIVFVAALIAISVFIEKIYDVPLRRRLSKRFR
jgi:peptidoglycan/LPS O-acetylase OafA/YrhL